MSSQSPVRGTLFAHIRHRVVKPSRARPHNGIALLLAIFLFFGVLSPATLARAETASGWGIPVPIEPTPPDSYGPRVAVTPDGEAIAVWHQLSPSGWTVAGSRYVRGYGWTAPLVVGQAYAIDLKLAADPRGDAIAVWTNLNEGPSTTSIRAIRYAAGGGWEAEQLLAINGSVPDVALDASGNATAVWIQWDGAQYDAFASRFAPGTGWSPPGPIEPLPGDSYSPSVGVDPAGNVVAVWNHAPDIYANTYTPGLGWGTAGPIDSETGEARNPQVSVGPDGSAVAVWQQYDGTVYGIWANRLVPGIGWGSAIRIGRGDYTLGLPQRARVAVGGDGSAIVAWEQGTGNRNALFANRFIPGLGWGLARQIDAELGNSWRPSVAIDPQGNGIVVWQQSGGAGDIRARIYANRHLAGGDWQGPELVETDSGTTDEPQVGVDAKGNAIVVWRQDDSWSWNIWANRYATPDTVSPSILITTPADGTTTDRPVISVSGITEPAVALVVNGIVVAVGADGNFSVDVALHPGTNVVRATATDAAGNQANATVTVVFADPIPGLSQGLSNVTEALRQVEDALGSLRLQALLGLVGLAVAVAALEFVRLRGRRRARADIQPEKKGPN